MRAVLAVLLVVSAVTWQAWAQESRSQTLPAPTPPPTQQPGSIHPSEPASATPSGPVTETTHYPLDKFQSFSAVQNGGPLPGMEVDRYIYRSGGLMRMQADDSLPSYYVTDLATQESHFVSSRACLKMEFLYKRSFPFGLSGSGYTYDLIPIGEETVDGHHCHVEDVMVHSPKNPVVMHFRLYEADHLQGFPIKIENRRQSAYAWVIRYNDVILKPQDPSLFIFPEKCENMAGFKQMGPGAKSKSTRPAKPK